MTTAPPPPQAGTRLVIYTVLIGAKEALRDPLVDLPGTAASDLQLDFVCITDNRALHSPTWRFVYLDDRHLPAEKLSRRPKALPHDYFPDADYSLYIDNTVCFKRLPQAADLQIPTAGKHYLFRTFRHATRKHPGEEAAVLATLGYESVDTLCRQLDFYAAQRPLAEITPLSTGTVLLRSHHAPAVREFGRLWWESILAFSKRDQLSLDYARQQAGCQIDYFDGITRDNDLIRWSGQLDQHRIKASFDATRYAWLHRDDPDAVANPRGHYLAHHAAGDDAPYLRTPQLLDYLCHQHGSSLGSQVAPRRQMADAMEQLLARPQRPAQKNLLVRLQSGTGPEAFSAAELDTAAQALSTLLSRDGALTLVDFDYTALTADTRVYGGQQPGFDRVIVLGAAGADLPLVVAKLCRLANRDDGLMLLALSSPCTLPQAAEAERALCQAFNADATTHLHGARHDNLTAPLPNSLVRLAWQADAAPAAASAARTGTRPAVQPVDQPAPMPGAPTHG